MVTKTASTRTATFTVRQVLILLIGWLIPGAAHWRLGRKGEAVVIFLVINLMFVYGLFLGSAVHRFNAADPVRSLLAKGAQMGSGFVYFLAQWVAPQLERWPDGPIRRFAARFAFGQGDHVHVWAEKGHTFTLTAGLLNILMLLRVYDYLSHESSSPSEGQTGSSTESLDLGDERADEGKETA